MNNSDYYHPHSQLEGEQQHTMQQPPRYSGGGNRGGNYQRQTQGQGGGGSGGTIPRHQHPNHQQQQQSTQQQQQQGQVVQQAVQGHVTVRPHVVQQNIQQPQVYFPTPPLVYYPNPTGPQGFRYQTIPTIPYQANQYQAGQQFSVTPQQQQQQLFQQQQMYLAQTAAAAAYGSANLYFQTPQAAQPQTAAHHNPPHFFAQQQTQTPTMTPHYTRLPAALPVQQVQPPSQQPHASHGLAVQGHQPQLVSAQAPGVINVMTPQATGTVLPSGLVTHPIQAQTEHRDPPPQRSKRILHITDPTTGEAVIPGAEGSEHAPSASPQPTVESVGLPEDGHLGGSRQPRAEVEVGYDGIAPRQGLPISDELQSGSNPAPDPGKAKSEFFHRITAANDSVPSRSNSSPDGLVTGSQGQASHLPVVSAEVPIPSLGTVAFEPPVAASAPPAFVHSHIPTSQIPKLVETENVVDTVTTTPSLPPPQLSKEQPTQIEPQGGTDTVRKLQPETETPQPCVTSPDPIESKEIVVETEEETLIQPVTVTEEDMNNAEELPSTPPSGGRGGRGDQFLDHSMTSISPDPIEKYIEITPEKIPVAAISPQFTESGEPSSLANAITTNNKEITVSSTSPNFPVRIEDSSPGSSPTNQITNAEDEINKVEKRLEELRITAVEPAQIEPTFTNGGNEIDESVSGDDDMEEGELHEGESDETGEPIRKRIVYDRDALLNFKTSASKDLVQGIDSIPPELIRDGNSSSFNIGPLPRGSQGGNFGGGGYGGGNRNSAQGGARMGNNNIAGPFPNRGMRGMGQGGWGGGAGPFQIPPPAPGPNRAPVFITLKPVELHKDPNAWKPGRNVDETKDKEQILIDEMKKKTRGILNKLTPENFDKLVQKFLTLKFEQHLDDPESRTVEEKAEAEKVTADRIGAVISVVFEKAIDEPSFSSAYAKMVNTVHSQASQVTSKIFRKKILDQCQKEFQEGNSAEKNVKLLEEKLAEAEDDKKALIKLEIEDKKFSARRRSLGNVRFIGELYKLQMLTPKIMIECIDMLIQNGDEESLECLCKLLTTVGQRLEEHLNNLREPSKAPPAPGKKPHERKWIPDAKYMQNTFAKLKSLSEDKALSSRIRFALLDVYELRDSGWKPRRDANAPKTIDEVRRAAAQEQLEEKNKLMNLPQGPPPSSRGGPQMPPYGKKGEWTTVPAPSNKSTRFNANKKPLSDSSGEIPKFAPAGGFGPPSRGGGGSGFPSRGAMAPRFSALRDYSDGPPPTPSREDIVQDLPPARTPSSQSSRESSRPHTPTRENNTGSPRMAPPPTSRKTPPPVQQQPPPEEIRDFDVKETVKQIFNEFLSVKKLDYGWIDKRFPGKRVSDFVEELARQVCDMSKEDNQKTAGGLVKNLIKIDRITKAQVIQSLKDGVVIEVPDIEVDVPKVTAYFAMFLSEVFGDEENLDWLIPLGDSLVEDYSDTWDNLVGSVLSTLKLRRSEEVVQGLYKKTSGANRLPIKDSDSWVYGETMESIVEKMNKVLRDISEDETLSSVLQDSFDFRKELTQKGVTEAICVECWSGNSGEWNAVKLQRFFSQLPKLPHIRHFPTIWNQIKDFMKRQNVNSDQEKVIWAILSQLEITPIENAK